MNALSVAALDNRRLTEAMEKYLAQWEAGHASHREDSGAFTPDDGFFPS